MKKSKRPGQSAALKKAWADPTKRTRMTVGIERMAPEKRARITAAMKLSHSTPEFRKRMSAKTKQSWVTRKKERAARVASAIERVYREEMPHAEIIRVERQTGVPDLATVDRLIQKRVAEAQATDQGLLLEPWFQPAPIADEIRMRLSVFHRRKGSFYFELYGCLICEKNNGLHVAHGLCHACYQKVAQRFKDMEKRYAEAHPHEYEDQQVDQISRRVRSAERILGMKPKGRS